MHILLFVFWPTNFFWISRAEHEYINMYPLIKALVMAHIIGNIVFGMMVARSKQALQFGRGENVYLWLCVLHDQFRLKSTLISKEISRAQHEYMNTPSLRHNLSASFAHDDITKHMMIIILTCSPWNKRNYKLFLEQKSMTCRQYFCLILNHMFKGSF